METIMQENGLEKWKKLSPEKHSFKKDYYVSNHGRVVSKHRSTGNETLMNPSLNKRNDFYYISVVNKEGKKGNHLVQKLVADNFMTPPDKERIFVTHKDGNRLNNQVSNLKFISREDILNKSIRSPKRKTDPTNHSKLTVMQVKHLKKQLERGNIRIAKLARMYNISDTQVKRIQRGENWGHVKV